MPQITSCPECSKKLRVPDELIGKKVKCPGCTTLFIAEADDQDEPAPPPAPKKAAPKAPAERPRPEAVTSTRPKRRDEEEEEEDEAPRPRGKRRNEEDEERPSRRREAVQEERPRRGRRDEEDEEEDRRPRRGRDRDDDEDDDDRPSRRRDDDDDDDDDDDRPRRRRGSGAQASPREQRQGWRKVRAGTNFVLISGWLNLSLIGLAIVFWLLMAMIVGTSAGFRGGFPSAGGGAGAMGVLGCGFSVLFLLLGLTAFVLLMVGTGFCMATPRLRDHSMRGLAMTAFYLYVGAIGTYILSVVMTILFAPLGFLGVIAAALAFVAGHVVWMIYLRLVCLYFRDAGLASAVLTNLIAQLVTPVLGTVLLVGLGYALRSAGGAGAIITLIFVLLYYAAMLGIYVWYLLTLRGVRDLVDR